MRPLVVLHGFLGSSEGMRLHAQPLGGARELITPELPGHGHAPPATGTFDSTVARLAARLATLPGRFDLWGYSQGARLALALALSHPERVGTLVLESGTAGLQSEAERAERLSADGRLAALALSGGMEAFVDRWEELPLFVSERLLPQRARELLRAERCSHEATGIASALRTYGAGAMPNLWPRLGGLRAPTLILSGELDTKFTALGVGLASALPAARHVVIAGAGHAPHREQPEATLRAIAHHLDSHGGST